MGYTRYYTVVNTTTFNQKFLKEVKQIIKEAHIKHNVIIRGWDGKGSPTITKTKISLNGDGDTGHDCETFLMYSGAAHFNACKTRQLPYDMVVKAILLLAESYGYVRYVSSDGQSVEDRNAHDLLKLVIQNRTFDSNWVLIIVKNIILSEI